MPHCYLEDVGGGGALGQGVRWPAEAGGDKATDSPPEPPKGIQPGQLLALAP